MRKIVTAIAIISLILTTMNGFSSSLAQEAGGSLEIGTYTQFWSENDINENHVSLNGNGLTIEAPAFSSALRINESYVDQEIGPWGADRPFNSANGTAGFDDNTALFKPLDIGEEALFTWGHKDHIQFSDRPMWVSSQQSEAGANITLDMEDGDTTGQEIFIAKAWLWSRGIHRPVVVHEDGTEISAVPTLQRDGWVIDIHHFTYVEIGPDEIDIRKREDGKISPWLGTVQWDSQSKTLKITVPPRLKAFDLLVEKDWFDANLPNPGSTDSKFAMEPAGNPLDLSVYVKASAKTTYITFKAFGEGTQSMWTYGKANEVQTVAFNETIWHLAGSVWISYSAQQGNLSVTTSQTGVRPDMVVNTTYLASLGINAPQVVATEGAAYEDVVFDTSGTGFNIYTITGSIDIVGGSTHHVQESGNTFAVLEVISTNVEIVAPAYEPWLADETTLLIRGIPWNTTWPGESWTVQAAGLIEDDLLVDLVSLADVSRDNETGEYDAWTTLHAGDIQIAQSLKLALFDHQQPSPEAEPSASFPISLNDSTTRDPSIAGVMEITEFVEEAVDMFTSDSCYVRLNRDQANNGSPSVQNPRKYHTVGDDTWIDVAGRYHFFTYENSCLEGDPSTEAEPIMFEWQTSGVAHGAAWVRTDSVVVRSTQMEVAYEKDRRIQWEDYNGKSNPNYHIFTPKSANSWARQYYGSSVSVEWAGIAGDGWERGPRCEVTADKPWYVKAVQTALKFVEHPWAEVASRIPLWVQCTAASSPGNFEKDGVSYYGSLSVPEDDHGFIWVNHRWTFGETSSQKGWTWTDHSYEIESREFYRACKYNTGVGCVTKNDSRYYTSTVPEVAYYYGL